MAVSKEFEDLVANYESMLDADADADSGNEYVSEGSEDGESKETPKEEPKKEEAQTHEKKPNHQPYMVQLAKDLGLTEQQIDDVPEGKLGEVLYLRSLAKPKPKEEKPVEKPAEEDDSDDIGLSDEDFDENLVKVLKKLNAENRALQKKLDAIVSESESRKAVDNTTKIDRVFADLDEEKFGSGSISALKDPVQLARRQALYREAALLAGENAGVDEIARTIPKAYEILYGKKPSKNSKDEEKAWREAALARPTSREPAPKAKGTSAARSAVEEVMRKHGIGRSNSDDED